MTELTQHDCSNETGKVDAFRTAFACVLDMDDADEISLESPFGAEYIEVGTVLGWLAANGYEYRCVRIPHVPVVSHAEGEKDLMEGYYVVAGYSPRKEDGLTPMAHAVIAFGHEHTVVYDPHPSRAGLLGEPVWAFLINPFVNPQWN